ncbi:septin and tuftelin-interacting protein 1 homolog 1-like [Triticum dicoccoides]|uniref:septin and tuftelin-interacting protein 1 homolog 1-like n=1 Tax=Triticum dicoccoides TaxID=85692 RepID=UPI001890AF23|nr:septin and tuftelin-interacting protein 1 homolog 1-like [Triticum dicoccoides]
MALLEHDMSGNLAFPSLAVAKMMRRWNYKEGSGLGAHGQGIIAPIQFTARCPKAGIGHCEKPYDNGLYVPSLPHAEEEWHKWKGLSRALRLEVECYEKILSLLRDMTLQGDDSVETAAALAVIVNSKKVIQGNRTLGMWKATLPSSTLQYIIEQVIMPRMAMDAREWMPSWDPDCHHWLRPLIPLIGNLPRSLYDIVESKISNGGYDVVSPWKEYLDPTQWDTFSQRHILPKLARFTRGLRITPPKQTDSSFRTLMLCAPLVHVEDMVLILEAELFFDKWEGALRHWLRAAKPSFGEATAWYTGWKKLFTPELLANERVLAHLEAGGGIVDSLVDYTW